MVDYFDNLERDLCLRINALSQHALVLNFFRVVSRLGDYSIWVVFGLAALLQPGIPAGKFLMQSAFTACVGVLVYKQLKGRLVRERPFIRHVGISCGTAPLDRYSFPSGHTLHAVSLTILFGMHAPALLWLMVPLALLIAASRTILGLHYPSDVLVGAMLGAMIATLGISIFP